MNNNERYFAEAEENVYEDYFSADGYDDDNFVDDYYEDMEGDADYESYVDPEFDDFDPDQDNEYSMVTGRPSRPDTSQPYIIQIQNTTTTDVSNAVVLGAYTNAADADNFGNGAAVQITVVLANVTYKEFLFQIMNQPFVVGEIYILSANTAQVLETITIRHQDSNGNLADKTMVPIIDPYQFQTTSLVHRFKHRVDGFTRYTIATLRGSATVKLYLYPSDKINLGRAVAGRKPMKIYGNPRIVKPTVTINASSQRPLRRLIRGR